MNMHAYPRWGIFFYIILQCDDCFQFQHENGNENKGETDKILMIIFENLKL